MRWIAVCACVACLILAGCQTPEKSTQPTKEPAAAKPAPAAKSEPAPAPPAEKPAAEPPARPEAGPAPADWPTLSTGPFTEGPLTAEVTAMQHVRTAYFDAPDRSKAESNFALRVRVRGEKIKRVVQHGNLILTELVDDTGHVMLDDELYNEEMRTMLRRVSVPVERLDEFGLFVASRAYPAAQGAKKLARIRGTVRMILADEAQKITIVNPLQYFGKTIEDPRLRELGIEIALLSPDELQEPAGEGTLVLEIRKKADHVVGVNFFDAWMKPLLKRERPMKTKAGADCTAYTFQGAAFDNEMQLVIEAYPAIEEVSVPVEADNVPLP